MAYELTIIILLYSCIIAFCRDNCRLFRLNNLGGCLTCRAGFTGTPECCQCEPGKTEINGVCSKCHIPIQERPFDPLCHNYSMPIVLHDTVVTISSLLNLHLIVQSVMPIWSLTAPVLKVLSNQTAVSVTQLEMKLMPFTRPHLGNACVSTSINNDSESCTPQCEYKNLA